MRNTEWKSVPDNAVPLRVQVGDLSLTAPQLLRLMAASHLAPGDDTKLAVLSISARSLAIVSYPTNQNDFDASSAWTFPRAPLNLGALDGLN
jgi:hypothetical protein